MTTLSRRGKYMNWKGFCTLWCPWNLTDHAQDWNSASVASALTIHLLGAISHHNMWSVLAVTATKSTQKGKRLQVTQASSSAPTVLRQGTQHLTEDVRATRQPLKISRSHVGKILKKEKNKPTPRAFNSKKVMEGLTFSSAVVNKAQTSTQRTLATPAQNRLKEAAGQEQSNITTHPPSDVEQMIANICPMLASLGSPMDKFMLLSKLVEICIGGHVQIHTWKAYLYNGFQC